MHQKEGADETENGYDKGDGIHLLGILVDDGLQLIEGHCTALPPKDFATSEEHQRGDSLHVVLGCWDAMLVYIYLDDAEAIT